MSDEERVEVALCDICKEPIYADEARSMVYGVDGRTHHVHMSHETEDHRSYKKWRDRVLHGRI